MSDHHPTLAPSSIPAILHCARFVSAPGDTQWSLMGTEHHAEFAAMLSGDRELADKLPLEERAGVEWAAGYVRGTCDPSELVIEAKLEVLDPDFDPLTFGRPDLYTLALPVPDLFDYKSGLPRNNDGQMAAYAVGIMQKRGAQAVNAHTLFGQTQTAYKKRWTYDDAMALVLEARERRRDETIPATPCDYCGYCARAIRCDALARRAEAVRAGREDWELEQYHASKIEDPAEMAKALALARHLSKWAEAIEHFAKEMAQKRGLAIPGYELREKRGNRETSDLSVAFQRAGLQIFDFLACCDVSLPAFEIAFHKAKGENPGQSFAASKRELSNKLADVIARKSSSFTLKPKKENTENADS
jgi:hypothetical protein